jgi:hypothetical protein
MSCSNGSFLECSLPTGEARVRSRTGHNSPGGPIVKDGDDLVQVTSCFIISYFTKGYGHL